MSSRRPSQGSGGPRQASAGSGGKVNASHEPQRSRYSIEAPKLAMTCSAASLRLHRLGSKQVRGLRITIPCAHTYAYHHLQFVGAQTCHWQLVRVWRALTLGTSLWKTHATQEASFSLRTLSACTTNSPTDLSSKFALEDKFTLPHQRAAT